jgi:hypothetical protein
VPVAVTNPALSALAGLLVYDVLINDEAVNLTSSEISQVGVTNAEGQHEAAVVTTQLTKPQISRFVDKPISFNYGSSINSNTFYGYVVAITPNQNYQDDSIVDIACIGVTWPMQNGTQKFVRNITAPDMFAAIVTGGFRQDVSTGYNLGAQVDTHSYVWPILAQSNESDWEYLLTLAERVGYAVYNYRGVVRMVKPLRILTETPVFASFIKGDQILDQTRTLLDWQATTQSLNVRQNILPSFGFFDGTTAATSLTPTSAGVLSAFPQGSSPVAAIPVIPATSSTSQSNLISPYSVRTDTPVKDRGMADTYSQAWKNRIDFWNEQAEARINGNARIVPGVNISVQVSGVQNAVNDYDGVWMVRGVKHTLTHSSFQTLLDLARDTTSKPVNATDNWFWNVPRGAPKVIRDPATNKWKSSWGSSPEFIQTTLAS